MRVLLTGHDGYIGHVLLPMLLDRGHQVTGLDSFLYEDCGFADEETSPTTVVRKDVREVDLDDLHGLDAVLHLAGISNDPLGDLQPAATYAINHEASVRLARLAKEAGVPRYIFSSSCSNYGAAGDAFLDESAGFNPVTPYAQSKVWVERDVAKLADDSFSPTFLRSATAFGVSSRLRGDLVVNNLVGYACTTGDVLIKSDGMPWRPLVHIEDIARAFVAVLEAPRELVHNESFNVGITSENYRVRDVAEMVAEVVPRSRVTYAGDASPDARNYRVDCEKIRARLPAFQPNWTVRKGIEQVYEAFCHHGTRAEEFLSSQFMRLKRIRELQSAGTLDEMLRWRTAGHPASAPQYSAA
ncbi:MAG TPA: NAD(P)-dependent oxidoreductase [Steroidobacteraceae bacterium]|nr:NAD(P)-dependent oxidoreductase [Steroidobacteraceae bacterium]